MARWNVGLEDTMVRRRRSPVAWLDGEPRPASYVDLTFSGTRDPVPDDVVATLPEGERLSGQLWLITETPLRTSDDHTAPVTLADHVKLDGRWYEVRDVVHYPRLIPHYEARVMRIKVADP